MGPTFFNLYVLRSICDAIMKWSGNVILSILKIGVENGKFSLRLPLAVYYIL